MEDKYYAILYRVINLSEEYHIYAPVNILVGIYMDDEFLDEAGNIYLDIQSLNIPNENSDFRIGMEQLESKLIQDFPNENIENIKEFYFNMAKNNVLFGMENFIEERMEILEFPLDQFFNVLNADTDEEIDLELEIPNNDEQQANSSLPFLCLDINKINTLIDLDDNKAIIDELKKLRNLYIEEIQNTGKYNKLIDELKKTIEQKQDQKQQEEKLPNIQVKEKKLINAQELYKQVTKKVKGQDEAVREVISCIVMDQYTNVSSEKNRAFLIGQSGSGKTLILDTVSQLLDLPMIKYDSTQLTIPGYVGQSLDDVLYKLLSKANDNYEKAQNGIVVFNEIDKKGSLNNSDVSGKGVLNNLLPFIDGTTYTLKQQKTFDTSNLTILFDGAFSNVFESIGNIEKKIGFESNLGKTVYSHEITDDDLIKYGQMPPELIGRISNIIQLNPHTKESLYEILKYSTVSPLLSEKNKLKNRNIELKYDNEYLLKVVIEALKLKTGARSLKKIIEKSIKEARWEILCNPNKYKSLTLTAESVDNPKKFVLK